ncbi:MAG: NUDIX hydrolase [Anaerolineaceae bacterium]|nr:NUDIX hydrolase [Anaerolineaceae bacterium]
MNHPDLLFKTKNYVFSYRLAGVLIRNGKVLLQRTLNDPAYAFPGGHATFPETNAETLVREFKEEISAIIEVKELKWVGEIFFPWQGKPCQQICLFYQIDLLDETQVPMDGSFLARESFDGKTFDLEFSWIAIDDIDTILLYPPIAKQLLHNLDGGVQHFVYRE